MALACLPTLYGGGNLAWAETVTYTWTYSNSKFTVSSSGTTPAGSSASLTSTYTNANQLTGGKTQTFTLTGYDDYTITGVSINLKRSSSSSAKANITVSANGEQIGSSSNLTLTQSQVDYPITVTSTKVGAGKSVVITVNAAANSIYVYNYKITYESSSKTATTTTFGNDVDGRNFEVTQGSANFTKTATLSPAIAGSLTYSSSNTAVASVNSSTGEVTIGVPGKATIQAAFAGNENYSKSSAEYTVTVAPKGTPVTYTITSTTAVSTDGTTPEGSAATYSQTYGTKGQMTSGNSTTLTLSGYAGCKINCIKLNMKSNGSSGAGTFSAVAGTTTLASIASATTFDKWFDNTEYSQAYKDILVTMDNTSYVIGDEENLVINIEATANSLYINSYTVYYEVAQPAAATPVITPADGTEFSTQNKEVSISAADGATIYYTLDGTTPDNTKTLYEGAFNISATTTVKAIAYETDKRPSAVASATITYVAPVTTFDINCNAPVGGSYTVKVGNEEAQTITAATVIAGGEGKTITLTTTPSTGYKPASTPFTVKDADEATVSVSKNGDNYTFTMPSKAVTITANYSAVYAITAADGIVGGTISFTDKDDKAITETSQNSKVNVVATPATGYELATLTYNKAGEEPTDIKENKYFTMPGGAVTVTATFSKINYTITYADDLTGGRVSGVATANYGDEVTLTATPDDGWDFNEWNVTSGENPLTVTENKITMPAANVNVSASFRQFATVTLSENGASTSLAGTHYVGDEVTLPSTTTAAVPAGKTFMGWSEAPVATTNDKPSYLAKGASYTTTGAAKTFYAVYATAIQAEDTKASVTIEDYATANSWQGGGAVAYKSVTIDENITASTTGTGNNGKYYSDWRLYQSGNGNVILTAKTGTTLKSATFTFTTSSNGILYFDEDEVSSGTSVELSGKSATFTVGASSGSTGQVRITKIDVTYQIGDGISYSAYETTVQQKTLASISVTGTPEKFWKKDDFNHNGMTVTASYEEQDVEDEDVTAFAEFSTPDMTTAGEKTVTVTYQGKNDTYNIEVKTIANTAETAYTTAQAIEKIDAGKDLNTEVYVTGVVSKVDNYNKDYHSITYWLDDNSFEIYGGLAAEGEEFSSIDDIKVGATVVVLGKIKKYNETYETDANSHLVSYVAPEKTTPALSFANPTYNVTLGEAFTAPALTNPEGVAVTYAASNVTPANCIEVTTDGTVTINAVGSATITASYDGSESDTYNSNSASYELVVAAPASAFGTLEFVATTGNNNYYATFSSNHDVIFDATQMIEVQTIFVLDNEMAITKVSDNSLSAVTDKNKNEGWVAGYYVPANTGVLVYSIGNDPAKYYYTEANASNILAEIDADNMLRAASDEMEESGFKFYKLAYGTWTGSVETSTGLGFYWGEEGGAAFETKEGTAYLAVPAGPKAPARFVFGAPEVATDIENIAEQGVAQKVLINGQVFILRGEKLYDTIGRLVK